MYSHPKDWIQEARRHPLRDLLAALGVEAIGRRWACPACGQERERGLRRGTMALLQGEQRWKCNACGVFGDGIDLVAWHLLKKPATQAVEFQQVRAWFGTPHPTPITLSVASPAYPPLVGVQAAWEACVRLIDLSDTDPVPSWLRQRGLSLAVAATDDLVRAAPHARKEDLFCGAPWLAVFPVVDAAGELRSLRFRRVDGERTLKSMAPKGYAAQGLVHACPMARAVLAGRRANSHGLPWSGELWIAEGEPDYLKIAALLVEDTCGKSAGSALISVPGAEGLPLSIASRIPSNSRVFICKQAGIAAQEAARKTTERLSHCSIFEISA